MIRLRLLYGVEGYVVDDLTKIAVHAERRRWMTRILCSTLRRPVLVPSGIRLLRSEL